MGDHTRFRPRPHAERSIVSYAVTLPAPGCPFGTGPHGAMRAPKPANKAARAIRVTCPLGTDLRGRMPTAAGPMADVGIGRFLLAVFAPVPMDGFAGRIALARFLGGTGSICDERFVLAFDGEAMVGVQGTRATGYHGLPEVVAGAASRTLFPARGHPSRLRR